MGFNQQRAFAKKKKSKGSEEAVTDEEVEVEHVEAEPVVEAAPVEAAPVQSEPKVVKADFSQATKAQPAEKVEESLYKSFSVGDVKQMQSTPDHKPPFAEDTIEGRYASVLFTSASQQEALFTIYEDIIYIKSLYDNSESFKLFTQNAGVGVREISLFNDALNGLGDFHPLTIKFLEVLAENKRLTYISDIADRYVKLYQVMNKEEKITIISADTLTSSEQAEVLSALNANP
jgi:ATP synthase F1 delta subunit